MTVYRLIQAHETRLLNNGCHKKMLQTNTSVAAYSGWRTYLYKSVLISCWPACFFKKTSAPLRSKKNLLIKKSITARPAIRKADAIIFSGRDTFHNRKLLMEK